MELADTLSQAYLPEVNLTSVQKEVEAVNMAQDLPVSAARVDDICKHTEEEHELKELIKLILTGWPEDKSQVPNSAVPYYNVRNELTVQNGVIFRGEREVTPKSLHRDMLQRIYASHLGIDGCQRHARECLYWPRMISEVKDYVQQSDVCRSTDSMQQKEPLQPHDVPSRPWAKVAVDLFHLNGQQYLLIVDYFSGFWEVEPLPSTLLSDVIKKMKMHFVRYSMPDVVVSDNGPQFAAQEFQCFSKTWQFQLNATSHYPKSNGKGENAVKAAKHLLKKAKKDKADAYLALLPYRNTPTQGLDTSPAQRLMSLSTKTLLPTTANLLRPQITEDLHEKLLFNKERQAKYYNRGAWALARLNPSDTLRMYHGSNKTKDQELLKASVRSQVGTRSYEVVTEDGKTFRRNRVYL